MPPPIENSVDCEILGVIFQYEVKAAKIHREIIEIYIKNMSSGMVQKWARGFKHGRTNVHYVEQNGQPSVITKDLVLKADEKVRDNRRFTIIFIVIKRVYLKIKKCSL